MGNLMRSIAVILFAIPLKLSNTRGFHSDTYQLLYVCCVIFIFVMQNGTNSKVSHGVPYDGSLKDLSSSHHLKSLSHGQPSFRPPPYMPNIKQKNQTAHQHKVQNVEKLNHKLKNISEKIEGVSALLRQKNDDNRCLASSPESNLEQSVNNQNRNFNFINHSGYQQIFDGRTTCPNSFKKIEENYQPSLRRTSNFNKYTKIGLSSPQNKSQTQSQKKSEFLGSLKGIKVKCYQQKPIISSCYQPDESSFVTDTSIDNYNTLNAFDKDLSKNDRNRKKINVKLTESSETREKQKTAFHQNKGQKKMKNFKILKKLGQGKFGEVFLAYHLPTKSVYALKKITKSIVREQKMVNQFIDQIKLHSVLSHPNIIKFFGFFEETDAIYLILEYVHGKTLFDYLNEKQKLPLKEVAAYLKDIIGAVVYLHDKSIAHRDIKPENILLNEDGIVKICDFGWSALIHTSRKTYCGTFDYVPPQILQRKNYDLSVDIWCIGILTYQLLTGDVPFNGEERKTKINKILSVDKNKLKFPEWFTKEARNFIEALIQKDPAKRLKTKDLLRHEFFSKNIGNQGKNK